MFQHCQGGIHKLWGGVFQKGFLGIYSQSMPLKKQNNLLDNIEYSKTFKILKAMLVL